MVRQIVAVIMVVSMAAPAVAAEWWWLPPRAGVFDGEEDGTVFVDMDSLKRDAVSATFWAYYFPPPGSKVARMRAEHKILCDQKSMFWLRAIEDNEPIMSNPFSQRPMRLEPGTARKRVFDRVFGFVCASPEKGDQNKLGRKITVAPETFVRNIR